MSVADGGQDGAGEEDGLAEAPVGLDGEIGDERDAAVLGLDDVRDEVLKLRV